MIEFLKSEKDKFERIALQADDMKTNIKYDHYAEACDLLIKSYKK